MQHSWEDDDGSPFAKQPSKEFGRKGQWRNSHIDVKYDDTSSILETKLKQKRLHDIWPINSKKSTAGPSMTRLSNGAEPGQLMTMHSAGLCFEPHNIPPIGTSGAILSLSRMPGPQSSQTMLPVPYPSVMPYMPFPLYQQWGAEKLKFGHENLVGSCGFDKENVFGYSMPKYGENRDDRSARDRVHRHVAHNSSLETSERLLPKQNVVTNTPTEKRMINKSELSGTVNTKENPQEAKQMEIGALFIAANISELKAWEKPRGELRIIFEVVGALDSQVTWSQKGVCKSFLLKDAKGSRINCRFYETDRKLDRMRRGKFYRCAGIYKETGGFLLAVSIRPVEESDVRLHRKLTAIGNRALKERKLEKNIYINI